MHRRANNPIPRMHADEVLVTEPLVRRLIDDQFPQWRHLRITPVPYSGTDNAIFKLGEDMVIRLPRIHWAAAQVQKEHTWLPVLAPHLPLRVPKPLCMGDPDFGYPWQWAVHEWLDGQNAIEAPVKRLDKAALDLAAFISSLHRLDLDPQLPAPSGNRGCPLADRDTEVIAAIESLEGEVDIPKVVESWRSSLDAPPYQGKPVLIHADLSPGNLLVKDGNLAAVIDFGMFTTGDPACDLMVAWNYHNAETRPILREALSVDDATWARGRGWALSVALIALPYYLNTNPQIVATSRRTIHEVLQDHEPNNQNLLS